MIVVVTYFRIRSIIRGFELFLHEHRIKKQLREMDCKGYRMRAILKDVYTMTMWETEEQMIRFARSGAHLESMKSTARLGSQFRSVTFEASAMPPWKEAIAKLEKDGKVVNYKDPRRPRAART
ncbi:MAG: hypothetical protein R3B48_08355 [Kofleriaceae bacterium]